MIIHYKNRDEPKSMIKIKLHNDYIEFDCFISRISLDQDHQYGLDLTLNWQSLDITPESPGVFYTDANAYKIIKRDINERRNYTPEVLTGLNRIKQVAQYFYPINAGLFIEDKFTKEQMIVMNDRSQGGSAYHEGRIELMVNRLGKTNDQLGVGEAMRDDTPDEKGINVSAKFYLAFTHNRE